MISKKPKTTPIKQRDMPGLHASVAAKGKGKYFKKNGEMQEGTIHNICEGGFGFIERKVIPEGGEVNIFFHASQVIGVTDFKVLETGAEVTFFEGWDSQRDSPFAYNVEVAFDNSPNSWGKGKNKKGKGSGGKSAQANDILPEDEDYEDTSAREGASSDESGGESPAELITNSWGKGGGAQTGKGQNNISLREIAITNFGNYKLSRWLIQHVHVLTVLCPCCTHQLFKLC